MVRGLVKQEESFTYLEYSSTEVRANGKDWKVYGSPVSPRFDSAVRHDEPVNRASQSSAAGLSIITDRPRHKVIASIAILWSCLTFFAFAGIVARIPTNADIVCVSNLHDISCSC